MSKIKKLLFKPRQFWADWYTKKRSKPMPSQQLSIWQLPLELSGLKRNFVRCLGLESLVPNVLMDHSFNFHVLPTLCDHYFRIAVVEKQLDEVVSILTSKELVPDIRFYLKRTKSRFDVVSLIPYDEEFVYMRSILQLDPWRMTDRHILSNNVNSASSVFSIQDVSKTVFARNPLRLQDERRNYRIDDYLNLPPNLFYPHDKVDVVYTWVDDKDPEWRKKKEAYSNKGQDNNTCARYNDYGQLRYSLRSLYSFCKFFNKIYIVTDDQVPYWLDEENEIVKIVSHKEIFKNKVALPVFNSCAIEANLHRISGISNKFLYLNDDTFFGSPVSIHDFVEGNGLVKIFLESKPTVFGKPYMEYRETKKIAHYTLNQFCSRFNVHAGFLPSHLPMIKECDVLSELEQIFSEDWERTAMARFRCENIITPTYILYPLYAYYKRKAVLSSISSVYLHTDRRSYVNELWDLYNRAVHGNIKVFCLNDYDVVPAGNVRETQRFLDKLFPVPAPWELQD